MKIGIIGMGFVGGTTAKVLEDEHEIIPYDKFKQPYTDSSRLKEAEVVFISVPTPMKHNGEMDYSAIHGSLEELSTLTEDISTKPLVVIRSTAVSGTTKSLENKYPFHCTFNPEFLREKTALEDMVNTSRVIIGANRPEDHKKVEEVYRPVFPDAEYIRLDTDSAEMVKYAANVMLASHIAVANEIYQICEHTGVDYETVKNTILMDDRIARNIDVPGPDGNLGFGGKCFPKDLNALIYLARENGYSANLLSEIWRSNLDWRDDQDWRNIPGATSDNSDFKKE